MWDLVRKPSNEMHLHLNLFQRINHTAGSKGIFYDWVSLNEKSRLGGS